MSRGSQSVGAFTSLRAAPACLLLAGAVRVTGHQFSPWRCKGEQDLILALKKLFTV